MNQYKVQIYVAHGYFEYEVDSAEKATAHANEIMSSGVYRHGIDGGVEFYPVKKVKAMGEGLESQYLDTFYRT